MYNVNFTESAKKEYGQLPEDMQQRVVAVLERISLRPHSYVMKLSGSSAFRLRVGKHRIILDIDEQAKEILVLKIGNRENVYG
jgi:mRNA interferase RelE/StbE